jgi:hypothetical protein
MHPEELANQLKHLLATFKLYNDLTSRFHSPLRILPPAPDSSTPKRQLKP